MAIFVRRDNVFELHAHVPTTLPDGLIFLRLTLNSTALKDKQTEGSSQTRNDRHLLNNLLNMHSKVSLK